MASYQKRITSKGETRWRARVRLDGFPVHTKTFRTKTDAKHWAKDIEVKLSKGEAVATKDQKRISLSDVIDRYIDYLPNKPKNKNLKADTAYLNYWKGELGSIALLNVTTDMIVKSRDSLAKGDRTGATVNRYLGALSACLAHCKKEWRDYGLKENPVSGVTRLVEPNGRTRFLTDDEREELLAACKAEHQELYEIVITALTCGARKGELEGIKWINVNFDRKTIKLVDTKNSETRYVPLVGRAFKLLEAKQIISKSPYVFAYLRECERLHKAFKRAIASTDIENFRFHDLRHSAASYLAMNGATLSELSDILGHKTLAMVKRYSHFTKEHNVALAEKMSRSIGL